MHLKKPLIITISCSCGMFQACGGWDEPSSNQNSTYSNTLSLEGTRLSEQQVAKLLREVGFPERTIPKMICTAKFESSLFSAARNRNRDGSTDHGLFQINDFWWLKRCAISTSELLDPKKNAQCAYKVFKIQGMNAWYGYRNHRSECDSYREVY